MALGPGRWACGRYCAERTHLLCALPGAEKLKQLFKNHHPWSLLNLRLLLGVLYLLLLLRHERLYAVEPGVGLIQPFELLVLVVVALVVEMSARSQVDQQACETGQAARVVLVFAAAPGQLAAGTADGWAGTVPFGLLILHVKRCELDPAIGKLQTHRTAVVVREVTG